MDVERIEPDRRLRIAVLADFDGPHARSWVRWFIARGHDVHTISFYPPRVPVEGATPHALRHRAAPDASATPASASTAVSVLSGRAPRSLLRLAHGARYRIAGLRGVLSRIGPDVFHAHYLVEHGFYGALAGVRPLVVTAWGSDVLIEPQRDPLTRQIARWVIGRADLVTSNNGYMARKIGELGALPSKVAVVTLGAERYDLELADRSVNVRPREKGRAPVIISTRAHEPLYNIGEIIDAHAIVAAQRPDVRLVVAHGGSMTAELQRRTQALGTPVEFAGFLDRASFRQALADAEVFVSVPSSDATSVALLQAMAAGAFPVVGDLPTQAEWVRDGVNSLLAPLHRPEALAERLLHALDDDELRRSAAVLNRRLVEERGLNETQMAKLEDLYRSLSAYRRG